MDPLLQNTILQILLNNNNNNNTNGANIPPTLISSSTTANNTNGAVNYNLLAANMLRHQQQSQATLPSHFNNGSSSTSNTNMNELVLQQWMQQQRQTQPLASRSNSHPVLNALQPPPNIRPSSSASSFTPTDLLLQAAAIASTHNTSSTSISSHTTQQPQLSTTNNETNPTNPVVNKSIEAYLADAAKEMNGTTTTPTTTTPTATLNNNTSMEEDMDPEEDLKKKKSVSSSSSLCSSSQPSIPKTIIRKDEIEAALRSKPQRGKKRDNLNDLERSELTKNRNREHAKHTRNRKKARYEELLQCEQKLLHKTELERMYKKRQTCILQFMNLRTDMLQNCLIRRGSRTAKEDSEKVSSQPSQAQAQAQAQQQQEQQQQQQQQLDQQQQRRRFVSCDDLPTQGESGNSSSSSSITHNRSASKEEETIPIAVTSSSSDAPTTTTATATTTTTELDDFVYHDKDNEFQFSIVGYNDNNEKCHMITHANKLVSIIERMNRFDTSVSSCIARRYWNDQQPPQKDDILKGIHYQIVGGIDEGLAVNMGDQHNLFFARVDLTMTLTKNATTATASAASETTRSSSNENDLEEGQERDSKKQKKEVLHEMPPVSENESVRSIDQSSSYPPTLISSIVSFRFSNESKDKLCSVEWYVTENNIV